MKKALLLIVIVSLVALWPFFRKGYFQSHDGEWMVIRFSAFHQTLRSGQFPVRFVDRLNNNYGYPVLNFLYPLPFYMAEVPKLLGLGFVDSIKAVFVISSILSVLFMFLALYQKYDIYSSLAGSIVYLFLPYRFVDLYVRGSLGESVAFIFPPLSLLSIFQISKGNKIFLPILAVSVAFLITAHNVIALLFFPLIIILTFIFNKKNLKQVLSMILLGVTLASFFWLPALFDLHYVKLSQIKVSSILDHLVSIQKLILPIWGYGPNPNGADPLPTQLGIVSFAIYISALTYQIFSKKKNNFVIFLCALYTAVAVLMTDISKPFWMNLPAIDIIQFPWRMLSIEVFISAILCAYLVNLSKNKLFISSLVLIASVSSSIYYTLPQTFVNRPDGFYSTNESTTTVQDEYLPLWVKFKKEGRPDNKIQLIGKGEIISSNIQPAKYNFTINSQEDLQVLVNTIYFPGWHVSADNKTIKINYDSNYGLINFSLPKGIHKVIINYSKTPVHLVSELISLSALIITGIYSITLWRKRDF